MKLLLILLIDAFSHATNYNMVADRAIDLTRGLIQLETVNANEDKAVALIKKRLNSAGIPSEVTEFSKGRHNIVARLKGNGSKRPMLILAHSDVVPTSGQKWDTPPHQLTEKDGYLYGRGVIDDLGYVAVATELLIEIKKSKVILDRDIIFAVTGGEEKGGTGIKDLIANHRSSIDAEFALNEGAGTMLTEDNKVLYVGTGAAEKSYQDFTVRAMGTTGHSSLPSPDNAAYHLANALTKLAKHKEPIHILPVTANDFKTRALVETDPQVKAALLAVAHNPKNPPKKAVAILENNILFNSLMRNTCVATVVSAGNSDTRNVMPAFAEANVNCRLLPGVARDESLRMLRTVMSGPKVTIEKGADFESSAPSSLDTPVLKAVRELAETMFKAPVLINLMTETSDSRLLRNAGIPTYAVSPIQLTMTDRMRAHAANERWKKDRIPVGAEFFHRLILKLAEAKSSTEKL